MVFAFYFQKFSTTNDRIGGGGKLPSANFDYQTTKCKYPNLPTTNDRFGGGGELPNDANCDFIFKLDM